jgi:hypothetical protein
MTKRTKKFSIILLSIFLLIWLFLWFLGQDKREAKDFANKLYSYPLPPETEVIYKGYDYGRSYGGTPQGNGNYITAVAYIKLSSKLSEKELIDYYKVVKGSDIYFEGDEVIKTSRTGRTWYEGTTPVNPSQEKNVQKPIELIVQTKTVFLSAFDDFARQ